jgi:hypothetical protein
MSNKYKLFSKLLQKEDNTKKLKKQKQKIQAQEEARKQIFAKTLIPLDQLKSRYEYTCPKCESYIVYDTLFVDDFTGKYIPLDYDSMRTHRCWQHKKVLSVILG